MQRDARQLSSRDDNVTQLQLIAPFEAPLTVTELLELILMECRRIAASVEDLARRA